MIKERYTVCAVKLKNGDIELRIPIESKGEVKNERFGDAGCFGFSFPDSDEFNECLDYIKFQAINAFNVSLKF